MTGYLLNSSASVQCMHGGKVQLTPTNQRVKVDGQPVMTQDNVCSITGCSFVPPYGNGPCSTGQWVSAATRVKAGGMPVLLRDSQSVCTPTGTGMNIINTQMRVMGI